MKAFRPFAVATLGLSVMIAAIQAARPAEPVPLPRERPADRSAKPASSEARQGALSQRGPLSLAPDAVSAASSPTNGPSAIEAQVEIKTARRERVRRSPRP